MHWNCSVNSNSVHTSGQTCQLFRRSWPLTSVYCSTGFTPHPPEEEMGDLHIYMSLCALEWTSRTSLRSTGFVHSPTLAPADMSKQWCNHQAWRRDMMEFCVSLSKRVTQEILRDVEKKNSPGVLQVKSQISLSIISYWLVTVRRSKYMFVFFDFHYPYWNIYMTSNQLGVNINRE